MSTKTKKIRVGMIRCDLHAIYYANLIQKHDPHILREPEYGQGGYFYFYTHYRKPKKMAFPRVSGFEVTKLWDGDRRLAENMSRIYYGKPKVCDTLDEVSDDVDLVFIADCNGDGSDHLKLASPGLKKRVPTFVDKPFAYDLKDARKMVNLAKRYDTPIMSLSMLRALPQVDYFKNRFREIAPIYLGVIRGYSGTMAGHIHGISLTQHLFGKGVEWVEAMGEKALEYLRLHYPEFCLKPLPPSFKSVGYYFVENWKREKGLDALIINLQSGPHDAAYASAYSRRGVLHSPAFDDRLFPYAVVEILKMIKKMVRTRKPQAPYDEMLECIAIATAGRLSQKKGKRVYLKDLR